MASQQAAHLVKLASAAGGSIRMENEVFCCFFPDFFFFFSKLFIPDNGDGRVWWPFLCRMRVQAELRSRP